MYVREEEMQVPQNVRKQFDTANINADMNVVEEGIKENYYNDRPYIPTADPRGINVVQKIKEGVPYFPVEDDMMCKATANRVITETVMQKFGLEPIAEVIASYKEVFALGGDIVITENAIVTDESLEARQIIDKDANVDFGTNVILLDIPNASSDTKNWMGIDVTGGNVVFDGVNGGVQTSANPELYAVNVRNGANLTVNGGMYIGGTTAMQVIEGKLVINNGFFQAQVDDTRYTLNCIDANYKAGKANIEVKGGTFVNFNPANCLAEEEGTNFVAEGFKVVEEVQEDGNIWYTVVPE